MKNIKVTISFNVTEQDFSSERVQKGIYDIRSGEIAKEMKQEFMHDFKLDIEIK